MEKKLTTPNGTSKTTKGSFSLAGCDLKCRRKFVIIKVPREGPAKGQM